MKNLQLSLKTEWFEMTKSGVKKEDYRELTPFWYSRLCLDRGKSRSQLYWKQYFDYAFAFDDEPCEFKEFTCNIMTLGYPKAGDTSRILKLEHKGIEIRTGNPLLGAVEGKLYFVIKHGEIV
jgi:hypothetical protein